jgi:molecular chaperone GrpE
MTEQEQNPTDETTATTATQTGQPIEGEALLAEDTAVAPEDDNVSALAEAQARIADYDDRYKRLFAEFDNFRRRTAKERLELIAGANADLLRDLLPVVDDMDRALKVLETSTDENAFAEGIKLVHNKLHQTLQRKGMKVFEAKGQPFDPDRHEAITQIPAPTDELKGCVVDEIETGYLLGERVLRFAKVVVGI